MIQRPWRREQFKRPMGHKTNLENRKSGAVMGGQEDMVFWTEEKKMDRSVLLLRCQMSHLPPSFSSSRAAWCQGNVAV